MKLLQKASVFVATGFFAGYFPFAPGTLGSVEGLFAAFLTARLSSVSSALLFVFCTVVAVVASHAAEKSIGEKDPGCIVVDEIVGMMAAMLWLPFTFWNACLCFVIFRVVDILKPFPIKKIEARLPGGIGIVADDIWAGAVANLVARAVSAFWGFPAA